MPEEHMPQKAGKKPEYVPAPIILRDHLAIDRTRLANVRTLLSFLRTSLYLVVSGLAVQKVEWLEALGYLFPSFMALAGVAFITGLGNYWYMRRRINAHYQVGQEELARQQGSHPKA